MRAHITVTCVTALLCGLLATASSAAPTEVNVRIEGLHETLFEGPILTEGHDVRASSDTVPRSCDGIDANDPWNTTPGATSTAASADAMSLIGETFDGKWYAGFEDYFITRWGPDEEEEGMSWGIIVNNVFTNVGGCQYELKEGDEVLWAYNAFSFRPFLALFPAGDTSGTRPLMATAQLGEPFEVEVVEYGDQAEDVPPPSPERTGSMPFEGADVSPVATNAKGFEKVETENPATVVTDAQGRAKMVFATPGWHRIKATLIGGEGEQAIRSNRLDVCVPASGETGCGPQPAEDQVRTPDYQVRGDEGLEVKPPAPESKPESPSSNPDTGSGGATGGVASYSTSAAGAPRLSAPTLQLTSAGGVVAVAWHVLEPGAGVAAWTISSKTLGGATGYVARASGTVATSASLKLPPGAAYELELSITDSAGHSSTVSIGRILVPYDDRWSGLRYHGSWRRLATKEAWDGTVERGGAGAAVSIAGLGAGIPVIELQAGSGGAQIEARSGSHRQRLRLAGGSTTNRLIKLAARARAGAVTIRVLKGTIDLDGVALEP
jgi:hypothetical protein